MLWGAEPLFPKSSFVRDSGGYLDFSFHSFKEEEGGGNKVSALGVSFSPKFPGAVYILLSSFHNPISLHGEEIGVEKLKIIILVQVSALSCQVSQEKANDLFVPQFPLL